MREVRDSSGRLLVQTAPQAEPETILVGTGEGETPTVAIVFSGTGFSRQKSNRLPRCLLLTCTFTVRLSRLRLVGQVDDKYSVECDVYEFDLWGITCAGLKADQETAARVLVSDIKRRLVHKTMIDLSSKRSHKANRPAKQ